MLKKSLLDLEKIYLGENSFLYGDKMTIADLLGVCELMQPALGVGVDVFTGYPKVEAWFKNVRTTVGAELFDDTHKYISKGAEVVKSLNIAVPQL